jgi:hypothetical protein
VLEGAGASFALLLAGMSQDEETRYVDQLEGRYANAFQVGHNAFEFFIECGQMPLSGEQATFHTRIITTPAYAKALFETLKESLDHYEQNYGVIVK